VSSSRITTFHAEHLFRAGRLVNTPDGLGKRAHERHEGAGNGGLNLRNSTLVPEAYSPELAERWRGPETWDDLPGSGRSGKIYEVLETEVIPDSMHATSRISRGGVARMRESMARLNPGVFDESRSPPIYRTNTISRGDAFRQARRESRFSGRRSAAWQAELAKHGSALRFAQPPSTTGERSISRSGFFLDDIDPDALRSKLYAEAQKDEDQSRKHESCERLVERRMPLPTALLFRRIARLRTIRPPSFRSTLGAFVPPLRPLHSCMKNRPADKL